MKYHYFRTMRGFIVLPADWQTKQFFSAEKVAELNEINILNNATPVLVDEYDLCCVAIRKNQVAMISPEFESVLFIQDAEHKTLSYISDYGVYDEIEDALLDMSRNEYSRVYNAITSARGAFSNVVTNLADLGYQFNLQESVKHEAGTTVWYAGTVQLTVKYNHTNTVTEFNLSFTVGDYQKVLTPADYGIDEDYARERLGIYSKGPDIEDEE